MASRPGRSRARWQSSGQLSGGSSRVSVRNVLAAAVFSGPAIVGYCAGGKSGAAGGRANCKHAGIGILGVVAQRGWSGNQFDWEQTRSSDG
jgi:hypothetical protein